MDSKTPLVVPPALRGALTADTGDQWHKPWSEVRLARLDAAVADWNAGVQAGGIDNPVFERAKATISRALEEAWDRLPRDRAWLGTLSESQRNAADSLPTPNLSNLGGRAKRLEKVPPHPDRDGLMAFIKGMQPLLDSYAFLRTHTRKRGAGQGESVDRYAPPPSTSVAVARTRELLEGVVERAHEATVAAFQAFFRREIEQFQAKASEAKASEGSRYFGYSPYDHYRNRCCDAGVRMFLDKAVARRSVDGRPDYFASKATWARADKEGEDQANAVRARFVNKNLRKLTSILEKKGDDAFLSASEIGHVSMQTMQGDFRFRFKDGSSFEVTNTLVFVVNSFGTHFCQYPLTFHHVVLPDGKPLERPSEKRMNEVFAVARSEAPARGRSRPTP